jgi:hypothetical protein
MPTQHVAQTQFKGIFWAGNMDQKAIGCKVERLGFWCWLCHKLLCDLQEGI